MEPVFCPKCMNKGTRTVLFDQHETTGYIEVRDRQYRVYGMDVYIEARCPADGSWHKIFLQGNVKVEGHLVKTA